jgi:hypothetical protein
MQIARTAGQLHHAATTNRASIVGLLVGSVRVGGRPPRRPVRPSSISMPNTQTPAHTYAYAARHQFFLSPCLLKLLLIYEIVFFSRNISSRIKPALNPLVWHDTTCTNVRPPVLDLLQVAARTEEIRGGFFVSFELAQHV